MLNIKYAAYLLLKTAFATFTECTDYAMLIIFYFLLYFVHLNLSIFFWFLSLLCIFHFFLFGFFSHSLHLFHSSFSLCVLNSELDSSLSLYALWSCEWIWSSALSIFIGEKNKTLKIITQLPQVTSELMWSYTTLCNVFFIQ